MYDQQNLVSKKVDNIKSNHLSNHLSMYVLQISYIHPEFGFILILKLLKYMRCLSGAEGNGGGGKAKAGI